MTDSNHGNFNQCQVLPTEYKLQPSSEAVMDCSIYKKRFTGL